MRNYFSKLLLGRVVVGSSPDEEFLSAGPRRSSERPFDRLRHEALIVELRRQGPRVRHSRAA